MVMNENEFKTKKNDIWTKDKIEPQHIPQHHISSFGPWRKLMNGDEDWDPLLRTEVNSQKWVHRTLAANLSGADDVRRVRLVPFCVVAVRSVPESFFDDVHVYDLFRSVSLPFVLSRNAFLVGTEL